MDETVSEITKTRDLKKGLEIIEKNGSLKLKDVRSGSVRIRPSNLKQ